MICLDVEPTGTDVTSWALIFQEFRAHRHGFDVEGIDFRGFIAQQTRTVGYAFTEIFLDLEPTVTDVTSRAIIFHGFKSPQAWI